MKRFVPLASTLALLASLFGSPAMAAPLSATDHKILNALAEVSAVSAESGRTTWPGFNIATQPIVVYEKGRVAFLFNHPHPPRGFEPLPGAPGVLKGRAYVHWGSVPELDQVHDIAADLGGVKVAYLPYQYLAFNNEVQPTEFFSPLFAFYSKRTFASYIEFQQMAREFSRGYPTESAENTALATLENRILAVALQEKDSAKLQTYGRYFLAARKARDGKLNARVVRYEKLAESLEGAMRYTETELSAGGASRRHHPLAGMKWESEAEGLRQISARLEQPLDNDETRHARLSATGVALGLLMDRLGDIRWKAQVTSGTPITDAFAKAVKYGEYDSANLLASAKRTFGYDQMVAEAREGATRYPSSYTEFMKGAGTKIVVSGLPRVRDDHRDRLDMSKPGGEWMRMASNAPPIEVDAHTLLAYRLDAFNYRKGATDVALRETPVLMRSDDLSWPFENVTFFSGNQPVHLLLDGREIPVRDGVYPIRRGLKVSSGSNISLAIAQGTMRISGKEILLNIKR